MLLKEHYKWPRRLVVGVRRPGMGRVHYFIFECGHAKLELLTMDSRWEEVNDETQVHPNWYRKCPVCYAERKYFNPEITAEYVESLLNRETDGS